MKASIKTNNTIEELTLTFNKDEIEMLRWVFKHHKKVHKMIVKKEQLLEPGNYPLRELLKKLHYIFCGDNKNNNDTVNETAEKCKKLFD